MPYDTEDEAGWAALPAVSDHEEEPAADHIGPLHTGSEPFTHRLQCHSECLLTIASQPEKVEPTALD